MPTFSGSVMNGGSSSGRPVAKKDPSIHWSKIPAMHCNTFVHGTKTSKEWMDLFIGIPDKADYIVLPCQEAEETSSSSDDDRASDQQGDSESETSPTVTRQQDQCLFEWELNVDKSSVNGNPSPAHQAAIEVLREANASLTALSQSQAQDLIDIRRLLDQESSSFCLFRLAMGHNDALATTHGSVVHAIDAVLLNSSNPLDVQALTSQMEQFQSNLTYIAEETQMSKSAILTLMTKVQETTKSCSDMLLHWIQALESPRGGSSNGSSQASSTAITADMVLGSSQIGGSPFDLLVSAIFGLVKSLKAKVQVLSERSKNTGMIFGELAFASEGEFTLAFQAASPSGAGVADFVDIISIWHSAGLDANDTAQWLAEQKNARLEGFTQAVDSRYAHSMSIHYPTAFAGSHKTNISATATLDMLKSVEIWQGGVGDGFKERLTEAMTSAVWGQTKYCIDFVPAGWLREHALKRGQQSQHFWQQLSAYIKDQTLLLMSLKLSEKNICLLMSHQVVQVCNDLYKYHHNASNTGPVNSESAACFAWITLQALLCMDSYLQARFSHHQGINATFMQFLTRTMADQSAIGIKGNIEKVEKLVKTLSDKIEKLATSKLVVDLDAKIEALIAANNLKRNRG
jgi:hypothetical protein